VFAKKEKTGSHLPMLNEVPLKKNRGLPFSLLGQQTFFQGKVVLKGEARLAGEIEGTVISEDVLIVEASAHIRGEIQGCIVEMSGCFEGVITVSNTLRLSPSARINGDISAFKLIVEEGAHLKGRVTSLEGPAQLLDTQDCA
jgi:cytoskeletal protein CcmA (bactofilin family)